MGCRVRTSSIRPSSIRPSIADGVVADLIAARAVGTAAMITIREFPAHCPHLDVPAAHCRERARVCLSDTAVGSSSVPGGLTKPVIVCGHRTGGHSADDAAGDRFWHRIRLCRTGAAARIWRAPGARTVSDGDVRRYVRANSVLMGAGTAVASITMLRRDSAVFLGALPDLPMVRQRWLGEVYDRVRVC